MNRVVDELLACYEELRRHLVKELRNPDLADDIAQHGFEKVFALTRKADAPPIASPRALLFQTARHLVIDFMRQRKIQQQWLEERTNDQASQYDCAPSAEEVVMYRELLQLVVEQLERLPVRRREVYVLFRVYGYSRAEIAAYLGISEAAVAKHVVRATLDCAALFARLRE